MEHYGNIKQEMKAPQKPKGSIISEEELDQEEGEYKEPEELVEIETYVEDGKIKERVFIDYELMEFHKEENLRRAQRFAEEQA